MEAAHGSWPRLTPERSTVPEVRTALVSTQSRSDQLSDSASAPGPERRASLCRVGRIKVPLGPLAAEHPSGSVAHGQAVTLVVFWIRQSP